VRAGWAVAAAALLVWLGMVLAISFLEAPLKFRAPDVTVPIGLGIGRLVFRALNAVEAGLATVAVLAALVDPPPAGALVAGSVAVLVLAAQLAWVRPRLTRRSDLVLAGREAPRSKGHYGYVVLEVVKVMALAAAGAFLLAA
jgi:hypothetical protein